MTTEPTASAVWIDGDPLMEAIAAAVWEHCARDDDDMPQLVLDDPRTIAAAAAPVARAVVLAAAARRLRDASGSYGSPHYDYELGPGLGRAADQLDAVAEAYPVTKPKPEAELPAWEALYEPGNVSTYLIGYTSDESAAKAAAEAWLRSQKDEVGRLEWQPWGTVTLPPDGYDEWFELVERHDDGIDTGPGLVVRHRIDVEPAAEAQPTTKPEHQPDAETLAAALDGLHTLIATSSRDWGVYRVDAWLWAVLCGWDCEQDEHDETCTHGALEEMAALHGWDADTVAKARRYRAAVRALTEPAAGARQDGAHPQEEHRG
jgi:hypothetical protein